MSKNTPPKFFPWADVFGQIFGLNIYYQFKVLGNQIYLKVAHWSWIAEKDFRGSSSALDHLYTTTFLVNSSTETPEATERALITDQFLFWVVLFEFI